MIDSRWKCPECSSRDVQVCLPAWFHESDGMELRYVEPDESADVLSWYCEECGNSDGGAPLEV